MGSLQSKQLGVRGKDMKFGSGFLSLYLELSVSGTM